MEVSAGRRSWAGSLMAGLLDPADVLVDYIERIVQGTGFEAAVVAEPGTAAVAGLGRSNLEASDSQAVPGRTAEDVERIGSEGDDCRSRTACLLLSHGQPLASVCEVGSFALEYRKAVLDLGFADSGAGLWE